MRVAHQYSEHIQFIVHSEISIVSQTEVKQIQQPTPLHRELQRGMRTKYRALLEAFYGQWFPHTLSLLTMLWLSMVTSQYCHTGVVFYIAGSALYLNITDCMVDLWLLRYEYFYTVHTYMKIQCIFHPLYNSIICFGRCTLYMHTNGI